jgi:hypothetical protein
MALDWGKGQSGGTVPSTGADNNFGVPQTGVAATNANQFVIRSQSDAGDTAVLARVPAPNLLTSVAHLAGDRRTHTDGLIYVCAVGGAAIGETPTTHPAKWVVWDVAKTTVDAIDTRVTSLEGGGAASLPVTTQSNTVPGGLVLNQRILVGPAGTGFFSGFNNQVATVTNPATPTFTFATPVLGRALFVTGATIADGSGVTMVYNGTAWEAGQSSFIDNLTTVDANAGLSAKQGTVLLAKIDAPVFDPLATYAVAKRITWTNGFVYACIVATVAGETPVTAPTKWAELDHGARSQRFQTATGTVNADADIVYAEAATITLTLPLSGARNGRPILIIGDWNPNTTLTITPAGTDQVFPAAIAAKSIGSGQALTLVPYQSGGTSGYMSVLDEARLDKSTLGTLGTVAIDGVNQFLPLFNSAGVPVGRNSVTAIASNGSIPAAEFGSVDLAATFAYSNAPTWADVPGMTVSLTSAGTWEIRGQIRGEAKDEQDNNVIALFDETVSTTVPVAGSECNIGFIAGTNNLTDPVWFSSAYLFRATVLSAKSYKLKARRDAGTNGTNMIHSDANGRSRLVWEKVTGFTPLVTASVLESNEAVLSTATLAVSTTDIDLTGCTTPVLAAGVWRIDGFVTGTDTSASNIYAWVADQANVIVPRSSVTVSNDGTAAGHGASAYFSVDVVSDGSKSYKLRGRGSAAATVANVDHVNATNNGACTKIRWTKIAATVPVSNNAESVISAFDNGTASYQLTTSLTYVDVTNAVTTLPSAGEWTVQFDGNIYNTTADLAAWVAICDMAGTVLAERRVALPGPVSTITPFTVTLPSIITVTAKQLKAMVRCNSASTTGVVNSNIASVVNILPRFFSRKVGALTSIPGTLAEVSGSVPLASSQATAANTTPVDIGLSFIAPESGTYEVGFEGVVSNAAAGGSIDVWVADGSNNQQANSLRRVLSATAGARCSTVGSCRMVMAAGDVAKIRLASGGANIATLYGNSTDGYGQMTWRKVTNYGALAVRDPEMGYFRLTAGITAVASANLQGAWAAEAGFTNTVQQVTLGGLPVFRLKAGRWYNLELYPYTTGVGSGLYDFWEWRTVAGAALPATAMGGSAYAAVSGLSREEMGAVVKGWVRPTIDTDVTVYCSNVSGGSLAAESGSRSTSIFINEMPAKILV